jgi:hypothetical protein
MAAALAGLATAGWAQGPEAVPSRDPIEQAGVSLRQETELRESNLLSRTPRPVFGRGAVVTGRTDRETTLEGDAEIRRGSTVIRADRITRYDAEDDVIAIGNVRLSREGQIFTGPQLQIGLDSLEGVFASPRYQLPATGGSGSASRIDFLNRDQLLMADATYSTCKPDDPDWYLKADELLIDAPPAEREVEFRLTVREPREGDSSCVSWRRLEELSPVVRSLAHEQFDDLVKRVRIFAPAAIAAEIAGCPSIGNNGLNSNGLEEMILEAVG